MQTVNQSINDILSKNATSFFIPPFQRAYAWGKPEIERYFNDVIRIIDSELDEKQRDKLEHFFGTLVIKEEKSGFANKSIVVDGQQRLTTTLLFLIALRDLENEKVNKERITQNFLINNSSIFEDKIKLKQVTKDWVSYKALVLGKPNEAEGVIKSAYELFKKLILSKRSSNERIEFEHYITALQRMNVAVIFLDERPFKGEDPQIIFETLNSLGKPLTLSDLVRNFILLKMESDNQSDIYENIWHPKIEKIFGEDTSDFFRDYLQYKTVSSLKVVSNNNTKELYKDFKEFVRTNFTTSIEFVKDIVKYVECYKWIITEENEDLISEDESNNAEIIELLRNIFHDIKASAFNPFVLGLLYHHQNVVNGLRLTDEKLISILKTIRNYIIRRRVLKLTQGENKNIVLLSRRIPELIEGKKSILDLLTKMFFRLRFPNDMEVMEELSGINFYEGLKTHSKFILGKIEEYNSQIPVDFRNSKFVIERIIPQKLDGLWKTHLGTNAEEVHSKYFHTIGNLILTEFGKEMGNRSFEHKKEKLQKSSLYYRLDVIDKFQWNEESIENHRNNMLHWFVETFPLPQEYKFAQNWNLQEQAVTYFSPMDTDASDLAEGNKPSELHLFGKKIMVKSWQDVFLQFLKYLEANQKADFESILENQATIFNQNDNVILKWKELNKIIGESDSEQIETTTKSYKTLDGELWDKVPKLNENLIFVRIRSLSASVCLSRLEAIMEKLFIAESDVKIKLRKKV